MVNKRYYDDKNKRLVELFCSKEEKLDFWNRHWKKISANSLRTAVQTPNSMVLRVTNKYVKIGSRVLEGGCGLGQNVWGLDKRGYDVYGVDNAKETLESVKKQFPNMNLIEGDVRVLPFNNNFFDAYWSLGVIEHFFYGYTPIIAEMDRVLKIGGYLFITFPAMNRTRKKNAELGKYLSYSCEVKENSATTFYQYILNPEIVEDELKRLGFNTIEKKYLDGSKGSTEVSDLFSYVHSIAKKFKLSKITSKIANIFFSESCGHIVLLVMRKNTKTRHEVL